MYLHPYFYIGSLSKNFSGKNYYMIDNYGGLLDKTTKLFNKFIVEFGVNADVSTGIQELTEISNKEIIQMHKSKFQSIVQSIFDDENEIMKDFVNSFMDGRHTISSVNYTKAFYNDISGNISFNTINVIYSNADGSDIKSSNIYTIEDTESRHSMMRMVEDFCGVSIEQISEGNCRFV